MKPVILFGAGKVAEVVHYYFENESPFEVAGITCDRSQIGTPAFQGHEIVPFEEVQRVFPPADFHLFIAIGYQHMNDVRAERVAQAREMGYRLASFVHERAALPKDAEIGENCFIMNHALIQPRVRLGHNVFVWSGAMIGHHTNIGDHCWITSTASICGDVTVGKNCFFAANSTAGNGIRIGDRCFLGANALVTKDLPNSSVVVQQASPTLSLTSDQFIRMSAFR